jgi:hypothetical protein
MHPQELGFGLDDFVTISDSASPPGSDQDRALQGAQRQGAPGRPRRTGAAHPVI